jgi:hypothetical protein
VIEVGATSDAPSVVDDACAVVRDLCDRQCAYDQVAQCALVGAEVDRDDGQHILQGVDIGPNPKCLECDHLVPFVGGDSRVPGGTEGDRQMGEDFDDDEGQNAIDQTMESGSARPGCQCPEDMRQVK